MNREGIVVARCTVERLMRAMGLQGARRGRAVRTTTPDTSAPCPLDHVNRHFHASRPNELWVSDFTYVSTWQGWLYVAFVVDVYARCADAASRVEDCDTDADVFHAMTRKLSLIDVKRALSERFKPEQIARLGNNHVVYPSLNRSTYQKLIEVAVHGYLKEIEASSGLRFEVTDAVKEQIYANSVFPTQGTRPVFSSVHGLMSAPLVDFTLWALEQGAGPGEELTIDVDPDAGLLIARWGHRIHTVPVALEISKLRQRPDPDMRAVLAVHEAGLEMVFGKDALSSGSEFDLKLATQQMAAFIRYAAFGERISHVDVSTEAGENINTDVASTNVEIEAGLQTQYERAQVLLAANRAIYLRMVNELVKAGQLEPQQIRDWLGLSQPEAPKEVLEPFEAKLREFERMRLANPC